ncbi:MAG: hypothetical protein WCF58_06335, partial [Syntrophobacteraceae bacterium]
PYPLMAESPPWCGNFCLLAAIPYHRFSRGISHSGKARVKYQIPLDFESPKTIIGMRMYIVPDFSFFGYLD